MKSINSIEELACVYGEPTAPALWKEIDHINDHYKAFIEQSPFLVLATRGRNGIDCSPRGDPAGFVRVVNQNQIYLPDRRGNNRLDSLRNIINNPGVGILFLIPGVGETIRLRGEAEIIIDQELCESFSINGKPATSVLSISVAKVYYQCQKAIARSRLWDPSGHIERDKLPTAGQMNQVFSEMNNVDFNAEAYDKNYPEHMQKTIY